MRPSTERRTLGASHLLWLEPQFISSKKRALSRGGPVGIDRALTAEDNPATEVYLQRRIPLANQDSPEGQVTPESLRQPKAAPSIPKRFERHVQGRIVAGLLEMAPLIVTVLVTVFIVGYADLVRDLPFISDHPWDFPGLGLVIIIAAAYLVGLTIATPPGRKLMQLKDVVLGNIPVVRTVFGVTKQAITSFSGQFNFSRVVFVEWPREGMVAMGFVTGQVFSADREISLVSVYIPTVPNPTSGNMAFVVEDDVMETDMSVDDAMKLVFSGGIVLPKSLALARLPVSRRNAQDLLGQFENDSR